jgi:hypothetical protein
LPTAAALAFAGAVGCDSGPKTYPVKGKVVFRGGKAVTDGRVQFQSATDPPFKALGDIGEDGSFSLTTYLGKNKANGAPAGDYSVIVELERPAEVVVLPEKYTVEAGDNDFTIVVTRRRR